MSERISRADQQANTRRRLLEEAHRLFTEQGFTATSVEQITQAVGVTRGALYKHFDGKEGLFLAMVSELSEGQLDTWSEYSDAARTDGDHLDALSRSIMGAQPAFALAGIEFLVHVRSRPELHRETVGLQEQIDVRARELLAGMCSALGVEPAIDLHDLLPLVVSLANGLMLRRIVFPELDVIALFRVGLTALLGAESSTPSPTPTPRKRARSSR